MSLWTEIRDAGEYFLTGTMYDPGKRRRQERDQRDMINAQMKAYQEQTNLAQQQLNEAREQTNAQKRRVEEKQIRSLRRNQRAQYNQGFLGAGNPASGDMDTKLGG